MFDNTCLECIYVGDKLADSANNATSVAFLCAEIDRRSSSADSRVNRGCDVDLTSEGNPRDVAMTSQRTPREIVMMSSPMSSSMPQLGPSDTIQPLNHIYRSSSAALSGCHGDDGVVATATMKRWIGRQGRHGVTSSALVSMEQCYWSNRRQSLSAASNSRCARIPSQYVVSFHINYLLSGSYVLTGRICRI